MKRLLPLLLIIQACAWTNPASRIYENDVSIAHNLVLPATGGRALVVKDGVGLADYIVIGEETIESSVSDPSFLAERGGLFGAQRVIWLGCDSIYEFWRWQRDCDSCGYYRFLVFSVSSLDTNLHLVKQNILAYEPDINLRKTFLHKAIYLFNPDSIPPIERIKAIEIYDENDQTLLASAFFDWNEQLDSVSGNALYVKQFLDMQPIGFLKQTNENWKSAYDKQMGVLTRINKQGNIAYRILPLSDESYKVTYSDGYNYLQLATVYYGNHDWVVGSTSSGNPYLVDFQVDNQSRIGYMKISNRMNQAAKTNVVRIYYRSIYESYPEKWRWANYYFNRFQP